MRREARAEGGRSAGERERDSVGPGRDGVVGRGRWRDNAERRTSVASVVRRPGREGYSSGPGAGAAGTIARTP